MDSIKLFYADYHPDGVYIKKVDEAKFQEFSDLHPATYNLGIGIGFQHMLQAESEDERVPFLIDVVVIAWDGFLTEDRMQEIIQNSVNWLLDHGDKDLLERGAK